MKNKQSFPIILCGLAAGAINGLFGAGGGMILIPLLTWLTNLSDDEIFSSSVVIITPLCVISLLLTIDVQNFPWLSTLPYLIGSVIGGILAGIFANKFPIKFLHRLLGILILWGGLRYLC